MQKESKWFEVAGKRLLPCLLQLIIVLVAITATAFPAFGYQLILEIYVDEAGKALVTGYIEQEGVESLPFLDTSEHLYEKETNQLYALTNGLTSKIGDDWALNFSTRDYYTDYHLPGDVRLGKINCSRDMEYFVSASNGSFVIDVQGYDIENPMTTVEYQQPLRESVSAKEDSGSNFGYLVLIIMLSVLALALGIVIVRLKRRGSLDDKAEVKRGKIEVTSDMARVMGTLTDRERAIVNALLKHNGEMTQADLRYETEIPGR
jgi:hypothetical protein